MITFEMMMQANTLEPILQLRNVYVVLISEIICKQFKHLNFKSLQIPNEPLFAYMLK